jgi:hypothetical protein
MSQVMPVMPVMPVMLRRCPAHYPDGARCELFASRHEWHINESDGICRTWTEPSAEPSAEPEPTPSAELSSAGYLQRQELRDMLAAQAQEDE